VNARAQTSNDLHSEWGLVCQKLMEKFGEATYKSWITPLSVVGTTEGIVHICAPTHFMRDWVSSNYLSSIRNFWQDINPIIDTIEIIAKSPQSPSPVSPSSAITAPSGGMPSSLPSETASEENTNLEGSFIGSILDNRYTFEDFVVGKPNELAYAAALRVAESKTVQFNPLFLYGGVGLGKTHLMHAIAWQIKKCHPDRRVIYLSAEKFMYQFIRSLRYKDTVAFKDQFRSVDVLMIDDLQFISGKDTTQEEFFHTFNALVDRNRQVIVSADKSPSDLEGMEERLRSRLGWGLVADIHPTNYELRLGILQAKAEGLNTRIPKEVIEFLAHKITSNIRELEGALNRIIAHSTLVGREINLEMTQDVLRDVLKANDRRITIEDIQKRVAEHYDIKTSDMQSSRRSQNVARPRQVAMFLSKVLTTRSLPDIGRKFGGRDHTTVLHAVRKVEELREKDREFSEGLALLKKTLEF
jgi:chromosomal replication initiator protein